VADRKSPPYLHQQIAGIGRNNRDRKQQEADPRRVYRGRRSDYRKKHKVGKNTGY
jgi:hypothetical protein